MVFNQDLSTSNFDEKKSMRKSLLIITALLIYQSAFAQLEDYKRLRFFLRQTFNTISSSSEYDRNINYFGFDIDVVNNNLEDRKLVYSLRNRVIGDFVSLIIPKNIDKIAQKGPEITTGLIGWWNIGHSVYRSDNLNIAPGIALHDYIYASGKVEPNGYYLTAGPAITIDYLIPSTEIVAHFESSYVISTRVNAQDEKLEENYNKDAEDPHFVNMQFELRYRKIFFFIYKLIFKLSYAKCTFSGNCFSTSS